MCTLCPELEMTTTSRLTGIDAGNIVEGGRRVQRAAAARLAFKYAEVDSEVRLELIWHCTMHSNWLRIELIVLFQGPWPLLTQHFAVVIGPFTLSEVSKRLKACLWVSHP